MKKKDRMFIEIGGVMKFVEESKISAPNLETGTKRPSPPWHCDAHGKAYDHLDTSKDYVLAFPPLPEGAAHA